MSNKKDSEIIVNIKIKISLWNAIKMRIAGKELLEPITVNIGQKHIYDTEGFSRAIKKAF